MNSIITATRKQPAWIESMFSGLTAVTDTAAVVVPSLFILGTAALESLQDGYSRIGDTVSALVWCPGGWLETLMFCLNGIFLLLLAIRLYRTVAGGMGKAGIVMLAMAGLSFLVLAACPTLAPGAEPALRSRIHEYTARGISAIFPLACLLLARCWNANPACRTIGRLTLASGVAGLVLDCIGLAYVLRDLSWIGALERLIILNGFAWLALVGLYFQHLARAENAACRPLQVVAGPAYRLRQGMREFACRMLPEHVCKAPVYARDNHAPPLQNDDTVNGLYVRGRIR